jgi:hypothetical protein
MPFYVPLGRRGILFQVGMILTRVLGSLSYSWSSRRRSAIPAPWSLPEALRDDSKRADSSP